MEHCHREGFEEACGDLFSPKGRIATSALRPPRNDRSSVDACHREGRLRPSRSVLFFGVTDCHVGLRPSQ